MERIDYTKEMVETFRKNVVDFIVPAVSKIKADVSKKLGIENFSLCDNESYFEVSVDPVLSSSDMFVAGKEMYHDLSPETAKFIDIMLEADAFDVLSREGKWGGGYCEYIPAYKQPFILANFNGTSADVDVLTHEIGHAFNSYEIRNLDPEIEYGMETAEVHSMSMEFFCWKYMDKFFDKRDKEYKYQHICDALTFIPYGSIVDEFQHIIYKNPSLTKEERKNCYVELEKKYRPHINMEGVKGIRWQYQMHIYENPFYYIDYCLAQSIAIQFLSKSQENFESAFKKYHQFILAGGTKTLEEKIVEAELSSPFKAGALESVVKKAENIIDKLK